MDLDAAWSPDTMDHRDLTRAGRKSRVAFFLDCGIGFAGENDWCAGAGVRPTGFGLADPGRRRLQRVGTPPETVMSRSKVVQKPPRCVKSCACNVRSDRGLRPRVGEEGNRPRGSSEADGAESGAVYGR